MTSPLSILPASLRGYFSSGRFGRHLGLQFWQILLETGFRMLATFAAAIFLGPALFGILGVVMTGVFFFQTTLEGMLSSLVRSVSREKAEGEASDSQTAFWGIILCLLVVFLAGALAWPLLFASGLTFVEDYPLLVLLGIALAVVTVAKVVVENGLRGLRDYTRAAILGTVIAPIQAIVCVSAIVLGHGLAVYLFLLVLFIGGNAILLFLWFLRRHWKASLLTVAPSLGGQMKEMAAYGGPLLFRGLIVFFYFRVNLLIIQGQSPAETGFYTFAERFMLIPLLLVGAFIGALGPRISRFVSEGNREALEGLLAKTYSALLLLLLPFAGLFLLSPWILGPIFPDYRPAMTLIQLFAPLILVDAISFIAVGGLLIFSGRAPVGILFDAIGAVANVALVLLLVRAHGAAGAVVGTLAVHAVYAVAVVIVAHRLTGVRFRLALPGELRRDA